MASKIHPPKVIPYTTCFTRDDDMAYDFQYVAYHGKQSWDVRIVIDELNDDLIVKKSCACPSFLKFNKGQDCKHLKDALKILKEFNVVFREDELPKQTTGE